MYSRKLLVGSGRRRRQADPKKSGARQREARVADSSNSGVRDRRKRQGECV